MPYITSQPLSGPGYGGGDGIGIELPLMAALLVAAKALRKRYLR